MTKQLRNNIFSMSPCRYVVLFTATFVCLSQIPTSHARQCGSNPLGQILQVAKRTGKSLNHVLTLLRDIDLPAYESLASEFRDYAACVGLVDTGYFRKRSTPEGLEPEEYKRHIFQREDTNSEPTANMGPRGQEAKDVLESENFNMLKENDQKLQSMLEKPMTSSKNLQEARPREEMAEQSNSEEGRQKLRRYLCSRGMIKLTTPYRNVKDFTAILANLLVRLCS